MGIAAQAPDRKVATAGVEGITNRGGRLRRPLVAEHSSIPGLTSQDIGLLAGLPGPLRR